jgi:hypothetical protein
MVFKPLLDFRMFVGAVVVEDKVNLSALGCRSIDSIKELQELGMSVSRLTRTDHSPIQDVERREESRRPMPNVVVRVPLRATGSHRKPRLATIQRLDLALLVNTQNQRFIRGIHV